MTGKMVRLAKRTGTILWIGCLAFTTTGMLIRNIDMIFWGALSTMCAGVIYVFLNSNISG